MAYPKIVYSIVCIRFMNVASHPKKIAVFGSAFNPPHRGHLDVLNQVAQWADEVVVVPNFAHAFGKSMASYALRVSLTQALVKEAALALPVRVSKIEQKMAAARLKPAPIYTFDVLTELKKDYPEDELIFIVGPDNADPRVWQRFYRADDILQQFATWPAEERLAVRSTDLRATLKAGRLPSESQCPRAVIELLKQTDEYAAESF